MLIFPDTPYSHLPPKTSRIAIWFFGLMNRWFRLPGANHRISGLTLLNADALAGLPKKPTRRLLFLPNHSSHSDAEVMMEAQRRLRMPSCYMAAYEVFQQSALHRWVMQKCGAFSVDRDGNDRQALKEGVNVLIQGRYALTIFPEGNVYLRNDRVTPFLDGAAFVAMRAQRELGMASPIYAVPVSIKLTHVANQRIRIREMIEQVADAIGSKVNPDALFLDEIKRIGVSALAQNLKHRGYLPPNPKESDLPALLKDAAEAVIARLEEKMELKVARKIDPIDRIRSIRQAIHRIRTDPDKEPQHAVAAGWADEAVLAIRILSYSGTYLDGTPSIDRVGEVAEKLLEDLYSKLHSPYGERHAHVCLGDPIDLTESLEAFGKKSREVVQELTARFESEVQNGLDRINRLNTYSGQEPMIP